MFENIFSTSPWVWTGLISGLVLLPILIHLINLLRHKRVKWAAMEFLLKSHKRNRNWVRLKQMLLLASRIAILLLILFMLGQVGCNDQKIAELLAGKITHHYVLIDDSFSMSDSAAGETALDHAREAMTFIAARAKNRENQRFTVLRFSRAEQINRIAATVAEETQSDFAETPIPSAEQTEEALSPIADLNSEIVDSEFDKTIEQLRGNMPVSNLASGPLAALRLTRDLIQSRVREKSLVYVLSDFREKDWLSSPGVAQTIEEMGAGDAEIELINCVKSPRPNLAITALEAAGNVRVAGVPLMMEVSVTNFSQTPARKVQIELTSAAYPLATNNANPSTLEPETSQLPTILIEGIAPRSSAVRRFPIFFNRPGQHAVKATLQNDSVPIDNHCWAVTRFGTSAKVLIVGNQDQREARFVSLAISPNQMTGIEPVLGTKATLRDAKPGELDQYESIFLLDVDQIDNSAVRNLGQYVERGGGAIFFAGPNINFNFYQDELYAGGEGLYPLPIEKVIAVPEPLEQAQADIVPQSHPVFAPMMGIKNSPLDLVQVRQICRPSAGWSATQQNVRIAATTRGDNRLPLVVEKNFGRGRAMAVLTTAGPAWNNWSRNGTFPAILLLMHEHVSAGRHDQRRRLVGESTSLQLSIKKYRPEVTFVAPASESDRPDESSWKRRTSWQSTAVPVQSGTEADLTANLGASPDETLQPGIYETWLRTNQSDVEVNRMALNVDTTESDLTIANRQQLLDAIAEAKPKFIDWDEVRPEASRNRSTSLAKLLLVILLVVLVGEQILAWSASYHPKQIKSNFITRVRRPQSSSQQAA